MRCAWKELLSVLPPWLRKDVDEQGREAMQELRLRNGLPPEIITQAKNIRLYRTVTAEDIHFVVNTASSYSPWTAATIGQGYITAEGGHRIGLCGEAVMQNGEMSGMRDIVSVCIRVARDFSGIADPLGTEQGSVLIIGRPGSGKTTLLRDLIRRRSDHGQGSISVVDERRELFPTGFNTGSRTDILRGCSKAQGIDILLRTMGPRTIAVDEITSECDCHALMKAGWCGVSLLATAHAGDKRDLMTRSVYRPIIESRLFDTLVILQEDKSWKTERMGI